MFRNTFQQKLAPYRSPKTDKACFHTTQAPTEKYFQTDIKNCVQIPSP